eukprot:gene21120-7941_t
MLTVPYCHGKFLYLNYLIHKLLLFLVSLLPYSLCFRLCSTTNIDSIQYNLSSEDSNLLLILRSIKQQLRILQSAVSYS